MLKSPTGVRKTRFGGSAYLRTDLPDHAHPHLSWLILRALNKVQATA